MKKLIFSVLLLLMTAIGAIAQTTAPYNEGFEDMSDADDLTAAGWISYQSDDGSFLAIETSNVNTGSKALNIDSWNAGSSSDYVIVGLPVITNKAVNELQITFSYKVSTGNVSVGYLTDVNDASTFVSLMDFNASSNYTTKTVELNSAPNTATRIAIKYLNWYRCYVDDIEVKALPTCMKPMAININDADITTSSAMVAWTPAGEETTWTLKYGLAGFDVETEGTAETISGTPEFSIENLTANTAYDVYVKAVCSESDESEWKSTSFRTECGAQAIPYIEGFEAVTGSYAIPYCWERIVEYSSYGSTYPYVYNSSYYANTGDKSLYMSTSTYSSAYENIIALPLMNEINTLQISLWAKAYSTIPEAFEIGYIKNGEFTFVKRVTLTTSYQPFVAYLNEAPADAERIAIRAYHSTTSITVYVDDIEVSELPTCITPENLLVSNITTASASVAWTDVLPATAWQYQLNDGEIDDAEANPINLTGLTPNTEYIVKVRTACGEGEYSEWATTTFTTLCEAITIDAENPYTEDFEGYTGVTYSSTNGVAPDCWDVSTTNSSNIAPHVIGSGSYYYVHGGENALTFYGSGYCYALLPIFTNDLSTLCVEFWSRMENESKGTLTLGYITDGDNDMDSYVVLDTYISTNTMTKQKTLLGTIPAEATRLVFRWYYSNQYSCCIDDLVVREVSTAAEILTYAIPDQVGETRMGDGTIEVTVPFTTDLNALAPVYTISENAEISDPVVTVAVNGESCTIEYNVTAEDGTTIKHWTVTVTKAPVSRDAFITGFTFVGQKAGTTAEIVSNTESNIYTVHAVAEWNVDLTSIAPEITVSPAAEITPESGYARDFTSPVTYTVTAEDGTTSHIYNVTIINDPDACVNPSAVNASAITAFTATLSWEQAYTETSYLVKVSATELTDEELETATELVFDETVSALTANVEGLEANTQYFVYIQSDCANADGWTEYSFRTKCDAFNVPFVETFEDNSDSRICWTIINANDDNKTWIYENGSAKYPYHGSNAANDWLISPKIAVVEGAYLTFEYKSSTYYPEKFSVYVMDNPDNYETATQILETQTVTVTSFTPINNIDLTSYAGQNIYIGIWCESDEDELNLYIDNFKVTFPPRTIVASVDNDEYGTIYPDGNVAVEYGEDQEFLIEAAAGYRIASVIVDADTENATDVTAEAIENGGYTFEYVTTNHTIHATFEKIYTIAATATPAEGGTIAPVSAVVVEGGSQEITIEANEGYRIFSVIVDEGEENAEDVTDAVIANEGIYAFQDVTANHTIAATFKKVHAITIEINNGGMIEPNEATLTVDDGTNFPFSVTPFDCYDVESVTVNDEELVLVENGEYTIENVTEAKAISVTFVQKVFNIAIAEGIENGTITTEDGNAVNCGENKSFTIEAADCYSIEAVTVDGNDVTAEVVENNGIYTFSNVNAGYTIAATFTMDTYTIDVAETQNGTITHVVADEAVEGDAVVNCGESMTFTITPATGYRIETLTIDGEEAEIAETYTFTNVRDNEHSIAATFKAVYEITITANEGGVVNPSENQTVDAGGNFEFTVEANDCHEVESITVNDNPVEIVENGEYTIESVDEAKAIVVTFAQPTYTIEVAETENGTITHVVADEAVEGNAAVACGESMTFAITPASGYVVATLTIDGEATTVAETYTFADVRNNHSIAATFELIPEGSFAVTVNVNGEGGTVTPTGTQSIEADEEFTLNVTTEDCHEVAVTVNGEPVELTDGQYTVDVTEALTINVTFSQPTYTITVAETENGTITPAENVVVNCGEDTTFTIAANEGYRIESVTVDEEDVTEAVIAADGTYKFENVREAHAIAATFKAVYGITITANEGGVVNPSENQTVDAGDDFTFTVSANDCYEIAAVTANGTELTPNDENNYVIEDVAEAQAIVVTFAQLTYTITVAETENGTITPAENVVVNCGEDTTFTIAANEGYRIESVTVDEEDVTEAVIAADGTYKFENVREAHAIAATFKAVYGITITANEGGVVNPSENQTVDAGDDFTFTVSANDCYEIAAVTANGTELTPNDENNYVIEDVAEAQAIEVTFNQITYTIAVSAGENGTITPNVEGNAVVNCGDDVTFTITPATNYMIATLTVDGNEVPTSSTYTFTNVRNNEHSIAATFVEIPEGNVVVVVNATGNGTVDRSGTQTVESGSDFTMTITPEECYSALVDGNPAILDAEGHYTIENVTENTTVNISFEQINYTIVASANEFGTIDPAGDVVVNCGDDKTFTFVPADSCRLVSVMVDGNDTTVVDNTFTFENVNGNHTIAATFERIPTYTITATAGDNGTITPAEVTVVEGGNAEFTITANDGYRIASVVVDNETNVTEQLVEGVYTFTDVRANHTIAATFEAIPVTTYTITLTVGANGTVTYNGEEVTEVTVNEGATPAFVITPADGYVIDVLTIGEDTIELTTEQIAGFTYTFEPVAANTTLSVTFVEATSAEMLEAGSMAIYPNPNNGMFSIDFSNIEGDATYQLINASGAVVETRDINIMSGETMNFSHNLRPGAYFVRIINGDKVYVEQIVVE